MISGIFDMQMIPLKLQLHHYINPTMLQIQYLKGFVVSHLYLHQAKQLAMW